MDADRCLPDSRGMSTGLRTGALAAVPVPRRREPADDLRVRAAAAVLAGDPLTEAAARAGVDVEQVRRWAACLAEGGAAAVAGVGVERPSPGATRVPAEDYLQVVAHELRTPLTVARAALRVLGRDDLDAPVRAQVAATVQDRLAALDQLAADLLDTVGVATGRTPLHPERVHLGEALETACSAAGVAAPRCELHVLVDPLRLQQVLRVLLGHALRYAPADHVAVGATAVEAGALVTVRVAGLSLTREEAAALMEPFEASRGDGNGLALYVVRTLVVASGGAVGLAGTSARAGDDADATVLWVRLPPAPPERSTP
jgi:signal transduction histidine kinase